VVIDPFLIQVHTQDIVAGLKPPSILVINTISPDEKLYSPDISLVGFVDATRIGLEEIGTAITNTCMIGAFARTTGWVQLDSVLYALGEKFRGRILERNIACARRGFEETVLRGR
jgi:2-oxoacid:acceptor oxidoreductase gamma subunit (pyruvate/2-ketoisovalerate family)